MIRFKKGCCYLQNGFSIWGGDKIEKLNSISKGEVNKVLKEIKEL